MAVEDTNGNLTHSTDQRTGTTHFEYDKLGRITKAGSELFALTCAQYLFRGTSSIKPDSFGTAATYCRKFTRTADIPT